MDWRCTGTKMPSLLHSSAENGSDNETESTTSTITPHPFFHCLSLEERTHTQPLVGITISLAPGMGLGAQRGRMSASCTVGRRYMGTERMKHGVLSILQSPAGGHLGGGLVPLLCQNHNLSRTHGESSPPHRTTACPGLMVSLVPLLSQNHSRSRTHGESSPPPLSEPQPVQDSQTLPSGNYACATGLISL